MMDRLGTTLRLLFAGARGGQAGQAYAEYGMILVIIGIAVVGSLTLMGHSVFNMFQNVSGSFPH